MSIFPHLLGDITAMAAVQALNTRVVRLRRAAGWPHKRRMQAWEMNSES
jgi:predicted RecB family endonuclease